MKADSPVIVDANAVLAGSITFECFKVIARGDPQIIKSASDFDLSEFYAVRPLQCSQIA